MKSLMIFLVVVFCSVLGFAQENKETTACEPISVVLIPKYPLVAWSAGIQGIVRIELSVSGGVVREVKFLSGDPVLKHFQFERHFMQWIFPNLCPPMKYELEIHFKLTDDTSAVSNAKVGFDPGLRRYEVVAKRARVGIV